MLFNCNKIFFFRFYVFQKITEALSGKDYSKINFFQTERSIVLIAQRPWRYCVSV